MKYIIYCRRSTDTEDKQVQSIESQESELVRLAENQNLQVVEILKESMSAKSEGRPVFKKVLDMIVGKKADGIICWKLDRLARNFIDGGRIIDLSQRGLIKEIRTSDGVYLPNDNVLMIAMQFGMANQYSRDLSNNVKRGNRTKLEKGEWPNHAPLGYLNKDKTIVVDKERAKYIVRIFEMYATGGYGMPEIASTLYNEGLRSRGGLRIYRNQIERIIKNPFYMGMMQRDGKLYEGKHQPLISKSLFDRIKEVANMRSRPRPKRLFFPLRGFLSCENCGCAITGSVKKEHQYYYCTNGKGNCEEHKSYMRENYLYGIIADLLENLIVSENKIELMYEAAKERDSADNSYIQQALDTLQKELESLPAKESKLLDVFMAEQISKELYDQRVLELQNDKVSLKKQIKELQNKLPAFTLEPIKNVFLQANKSRKEFLEGNEDKKREVVKNLLWNLSVKNKNIVAVKYKNVFQSIAKMPKNGSIYEMLRG
jgi:site-specific DNA recombinase